MRKVDIMVGIGILIINIFTIRISLTYTNKMFPLGISCLASVLAIILILFPSNREKTIPNVDLKKLFMIISIIILYLILMPLVGYVIATLIFLFFALYLSGQRSKIILLTIPIGLTITIYFIFGHFLNVFLPKGILTGF